MGKAQRQTASDARWAKERAAGRKAYVLKRGVLGWGLPMFVAMTLVVPLVRGEAITPTSLVIGAIIWLLAGVAFGFFTWHLTEKGYQERVQ